MKRAYVAKEVIAGGVKIQVKQVLGCGDTDFATVCSVSPRPRVAGQDPARGPQR